MTISRQQRLETALFRGNVLTLGNPEYVREVQVLMEALLRVDLAPKDLTVDALRLPSEPVTAVIMAKERGVMAGLAELALFTQSHGLVIHCKKKDGDVFEPEEILLNLVGDRNVLLSLERVGLNLLQRMTGIATLTQNLQNRVQTRSCSTRLVATRKTLWGLLDKRAVHVGGGGTHRLGLGDGILIKNNHLALIAQSEQEAVPAAIARAWDFRGEAAFIEVEVRSLSSTVAAASAFRRLQDEYGESYPCLILLDNLAPLEIASILKELRRMDLWEYVLVEASGGIAASNLEEYAETGVDAISMGALTHSARSLDLCQRIA